MSQTLLLMAHPGHELLLHHWMERHRPVTFALSDGSGSTGISRVERSKRIIKASGATVGSAFGLMPDQDWYRAIIARDIAPFMHAVETITAYGLQAPFTVVSDSIEYFNPLHDLCCVIAHVVTFKLNARSATPALHFDYSLETASARQPEILLELDGAALVRKYKAIENYEELKPEIERRSVGTTRYEIDREALHLARCLEMWPKQLQFEPLYERYGRMRVATGTYRDTITYEHHVRPLALRLIDQTSC